MPKVIKLRRPEAGDEHGVCFYRHHECRDARTMRAALDNDDADILQFNVGAFGWEMPLNTPFAVISTDDCGVCGASVGAWFEWTGPQVFASKSKLWTPGG